MDDARSLTAEKIDEGGDPSPRFAAYHNVLLKYAAVPEIPSIQPAPQRAYGALELRESIGLFDALGVLSRKHLSVMPDPLEFFDQDHGFILYRTRLSGPRPEALLVAHEVRDRAQVFVDSRAIGVLERETGDEALSLEIPLQGVTLDLLVENMGRANFGPGLVDRKGIAGSVAWVNGFNLGRCWQRGPQQTPDVPAPILKPGLNEIIVFELHGAERLTVELRDKPELG